MMMQLIMRSALLLLMLLVAACQPLQTPTPAATPGMARATRPPQVAQPEARPPAAASGTTTPSPSPGPSAQAAETSASSLPEPSLFAGTWDDRSPYARGLVSASQGVLEDLADAPVYHMQLDIGDDLTTLTGRMEVLYTNTAGEPLNEIYFRLYPNLTGGSAAVEDLQVNQVPVAPRFELRNSALAVPLADPLLPGQRAVISMDFSVQVPTDESSNYGTFAYLGDVLALAHFYPMLVVHDDRGWNLEIPSPQGDVVYADAGLYLVRITAPVDLVLAASGVTIDEQRAGSRQEVTVAAGPARDFYLAGSRDYQVNSAKVGETTVNAYAFPELAEGSQLALDYAVSALESFEARFGPYPLTELDVVGTATSALGVEYPGIVAVTNRIYDPEWSDYLESTTAHEVAHQWFYNLVGNDQLDEPWLDEALTQYATLLYYQDAYGPAGYQGYRESLTGRWSRVEFAEIPIGMPVSEYRDREYGAIVYGRGPLFFEALAQEMGEETFDGFLSDYVRVFAWDNVTTEELKALAEVHCQCDLTPLFEAWVYDR